MTEADLCAILWKELAVYGWNLHAEVPVVIDGQTYRPDIVAARGKGNIMVWQAKLKLGPVVLSQAIRIRPYTEYIAVVVGEPLTRSAAHTMRRGILQRHGIGLSYVSEAGRIDDEVLPAIHQVRKDDRILEGLTEAQKHDTPGRPGGKVIRPDKWDEVRAWISDHKGIRLSQIVTDLNWNHDTRKEFTRLTMKDKIRGIGFTGAPAEYYCNE